MDAQAGTISRREQSGEISTSEARRQILELIAGTKIIETAVRHHKYARVVSAETLKDIESAVGEAIAYAVLHGTYDIRRSQVKSLEGYVRASCHYTVANELRRIWRIEQHRSDIDIEAAQRQAFYGDSNFTVEVDDENGINFSALTTAAKSVERRLDTSHSRTFLRCALLRKGFDVPYMKPPLSPETRKNIESSVRVAGFAEKIAHEVLEQRKNGTVASQPEHVIWDNWGEEKLSWLMGLPDGAVGMFITEAVSPMPRPGVSIMNSVRSDMGLQRTKIGGFTIEQVHREWANIYMAGKPSDTDVPPNFFDEHPETHEAFYRGHIKHFALKAGAQ